MLGGLVLIMPQQYKDRFMTIFDVNAQDDAGAGESAMGRLNGLVYGLKFMAERPLTGVGIGNFRWKYRQEAGSWSDAHNLIGKLAGELGVLGIVSFVYFLYVFITNLKDIKNKYLKYHWDEDFNYHLNDAVKISLVMLLFQGLSGHNLFRPNWYINACFLVIMMRQVNIRIEEEKELLPPVPSVEENIV